MQTTKHFWQSKGVWLGVCVFVIGAVEIVQNLIVNGDFSVLALLTAVAGVAKVVERIMRTNSDITL